jgi:hypothetical protein
MSGTDDADRRNELEARLAETRRELVDLFGPESGGEQPGPETGADLRQGRHRRESGFPRSGTMRLLLSSRGLGALAVAACGLLVSRPALALRLLRLVPVGTFARILAYRFFSSQGSKV